MPLHLWKCLLLHVRVCVSLTQKHVWMHLRGVCTNIQHGMLMRTYGVGMGLLAAMRATSELASIPVIFLSARAGEESRSEGKFAHLLIAVLFRETNGNTLLIA